MSNTLIIDAQMIDRITMMREETRGAFIEKFYTTPEFVFKYQNFKNRIEKMKEEIKKVHEFQKELKSDKDIEKTKVNNLKSFRDKVKDFNKRNEELLLFELYQNNKAIEDGPIKMRELQSELEEIKERLLETSNVRGINIEDFLSLEGMSLESNLKLREKLKEDLKVEQTLEGIRQEIEYLEFQSNSSFDVSIFQNEIDRNTQNIENLDDIKEKIEPIHEEFLQLKKAFMSDTLKVFVPYSTMKKLIFDEINSVHENLKLFENQLATFVTDRSFYDEKIKFMESERGKVVKEIETLVKKKVEMSARASTKIRAISKLEPITNIKPKVKSNKQAILDKLRKKFSYSIVGHLCDLFDVTPVNGIEVKHHHILERLGKYSEAIIVDSQEVAEKCVQFLKLQGHQPINTLIIPLSNISDLSTADLMSKHDIPENLKAEPIESFIQAKHPEIQKLIINILKPTIVTDAAPNLEYIFDGKIKFQFLDKFQFLNKF
jgi:chromosome segregation ATPase